MNLNNILDNDIKAWNLDSLSKEYFDKYSNNKVIKNLQTPCYIIDKNKLEKNINNIKEDYYKFFKKDKLDIYYPIKINNHKFILNKMIENNIWLEVASIDEYKLALELWSSKILYYAPWKTKEDLLYFIENCTNNHIIHLDSFFELDKISNLVNILKKKINIWVRIYTDDFWEWQKYWINLNHLKDFIIKSNKNKFLNFLWIHFHTSRNKTSEIYTKTIKNIWIYFKTLNKKILSQIKYIDFWWWFEKNWIEWTYYKWTIKWQTEKLLWNLNNINWNKIIILESQKTKEYFRDIFFSIKNNILPLFWADIKFITEPWRIFVSDVMHILSRIVDVKNVEDNIVILDSWVNMIWWQRWEFEYFPVINLSSNKIWNNQNSLIYWNLCTTWDHWWYYCYTDKKLKQNDLLLISNQGTLSYSLAQNFFINKLPKTYIV